MRRGEARRAPSSLPPSHQVTRASKGSVPLCTTMPPPAILGHKAVGKDVEPPLTPPFRAPSPLPSRAAAASSRRAMAGSGERGARGAERQREEEAEGGGQREAAARGHMTGASRERSRERGVGPQRA